MLNDEIRKNKNKKRPSSLAWAFKKTHAFFLSGRYIIYWVVCPESGYSGWKIKRGWHKNLFSPKNTLKTPYKPSLTTY